MIAIHTYVPSQIEKRSLDRSMIYQMILSTHLAKHSFEKVVLYTTKEIEKIVRYVGIPYDEIITEPFDGYEGKTFSIPKLITYSLQTEPFAHIDLDTFIYALPKKIEGVPVFYAYHDIPLLKENSFKTNKSMYETYLKGTFEISDKIPEELKKHINFFSIPNMSIFGGEDFELISKASKYCLEIYEKNKDHFDSNYYYACVIEQLLIHSAIKMFSEEKEEEDEIFYIYTPQENLAIEHPTESLETISYPFHLYFYGRKKYVYDETQLYQFANYDFDWVIHLCGNKNLDAVLFIIKETIVQRFNGAKYLKKINELYPEFTEAEKISSRYYARIKNKLNEWIQTNKTDIL